MPSDPGPTVQLQISPVGAIAQGSPPPTTATYQEPVYSPPTSVVVTQPDYPVYVQRPYYPPISLNLGYMYWGTGRGGHGAHRGHWR